LDISVYLILPAALCALESTQRLTEMSTRSLPEGNGMVWYVQRLVSPCTATSMWSIVRPL
jgi:hypothetical protein